MNIKLILAFLVGLTGCNDETTSPEDQLQTDEETESRLTPEARVYLENQLRICASEVEAILGINSEPITQVLTRSCGDPGRQHPICPFDFSPFEFHQNISDEVLGEDAVARLNRDAANQVFDPTICNDFYGMTYGITLAILRPNIDMSVVLSYPYNSLDLGLAELVKQLIFANRFRVAPDVSELVERVTVQEGDFLYDQGTSGIPELPEQYQQMRITYLDREPPYTYATLQFGPDLTNDPINSDEHDLSVNRCLDFEGYLLVCFDELADDDTGALFSIYDGAGRIYPYPTDLIFYTNTPGFGIYYYTVDGGRAANYLTLNRHLEDWCNSDGDWVRAETFTFWAELESEYGLETIQQLISDMYYLGREVDEYQSYPFFEQLVAITGDEAGIRDIFERHGVPTWPGYFGVGPSGE